MLGTASSPTVVPRADPFGHGRSVKPSWIRGRLVRGVAVDGGLAVSVVDPHPAAVSTSEPMHRKDETSDRIFGRSYVVAPLGSEVGRFQTAA